MNAHAEELRSSFVAHEGKKELVVSTVGTRYTVDFGWMSRKMAELMPPSNPTSPNPGLALIQ